MHSWRDYVSTLTVNTPMSKIWKMKGTYQQISDPYLMEDVVHITDPVEVATVLAEHYASVSANNAHPPEFCSLKTRLESSHLDFSTGADLDYNSNITFLEFSVMLSRCKNTATGEDGISF